jgi:uncharacterized protein (TIGR00369 family)
MRPISKEPDKMKQNIGDWLRKYLNRTLTADDTTTMIYPPPIAKTLGFDLIELGEATATLEMKTDLKIHANPMGTIHGGVLCDIADAAIGTAHSTTLQDNESFTSIDLRINFFRPLRDDTIRAKAHVVHLGGTVSYYSCDITKSDGKIVATVTSSVMTLRGEKSIGR